MLHTLNTGDEDDDAADSSQRCNSARVMNLPVERFVRCSTCFNTPVPAIVNTLICAGLTPGRGVEQKLRAWAARPGVERCYPTQQRNSGRLAYTTKVELYRKIGLSGRWDVTPHSRRDCS